MAAAWTSIAKERAEGNLEEAVALYQKVIDESQDMTLKAKAQLQIGMCYEKLGQKSIKQAQVAFQKVLDLYPTESSAVKMARERLSVLVSAKSPVSKSGDEFRIRKVWEFPPMGRGNLGRVSPDGKLIFAAIGEKYMAFQAVLISVEDGSMRVLKEYDSPPTSEPRRLGLFSPDSKYIAGDFSSEGDSRKRDISLLAVDGSSEISLNDHPEDDLTLGWSNDGKTVIFASKRSGTWDLWAVEVKKGKPQGEPSLIKESLGAISPLGITKDNSFHYLLQGNLRDIVTTK